MTSRASRRFLMTPGIMIMAGCTDSSDTTMESGQLKLAGITQIDGAVVSSEPEDKVCCLPILALLTPVESLKQRDWVLGGIFQAPRGVERVSDELARFWISLPAAPGFYRPRHPEKTVLYRVLFHYFDQFLADYESRFEKEYGFLWPIIKETSAAHHEPRRAVVISRCFA